MNGLNDFTIKGYVKVELKKKSINLTLRDLSINLTLRDLSGQTKSSEDITTLAFASLNFLSISSSPDVNTTSQLDRTKTRIYYVTNFLNRNARKRRHQPPGVALKCRSHEKFWKIRETSVAVTISNVVFQWKSLRSNYRKTEMQKAYNRIILEIFVSNNLLMEQWPIG